MRIFSAEDRLNIVYEGPPTVVGGSSVPGDRFCLAGDRLKQAQEGVELARGLSGILRQNVEYRYDTSANQPGSTFIDYVGNRRIFQGSINVFGDSPGEFRSVWRRWIKSHPYDREGKLWFYTSDAPDRYAFVRPSAEAGMSSLDIDPNIFSKFTDLEWGWESDYPYLFGNIQRVDFDEQGVAEFMNESDVRDVYPKIYLPGPGRYIMNGITTPTLSADEVIRFNFDPMRETYVKRNVKTGAVTNLWYTLVGKRPKMVLTPGSNRVQITPPAIGVKSGAYVEYTPLFQGAM